MSLENAGPGAPVSRPLELVSHHLCPYVQRAAIALHEKGVKFQRTQVDLADKPQWFREISPLGKVPLLRVRRSDGGEAVLFESAVICEYIEETQPGLRLHPEDPLTRAEHRAWMEFGSAILGDIWGLETAKEKDPFEAKRLALCEKFLRIESMFGDGPYFAGARFSMVDAVFGPVFRYFDVFDAITDLGILDEMPKVRLWRAALAARPSVAAAVGADDYHQRLRAFLRRHEAYLLRA